MIGKNLTLSDIDRLKSKTDYLSVIKDYYCYSNKVKDSDLMWLIDNEKRDKDIIQTAVLTLLVRHLEKTL